MRLQKIKIQNFRKIEDLTVIFPHGLCVLVGENNVGKTAIIDALRLMLLPGRDSEALRISEDDFRNGTGYAPIEISCTFSDLTDEDEAHCQECLVDVGDNKFHVQLNAYIHFNEDTGRASVKMWGGETEAGVLPFDFYDRIASIYLQPLRDPERGLRPSQKSQVSRLINCLTDETQYPEFESITKDANDRIRELSSVKAATKDMNSQLSAITGPELSQNTELVFIDPTFRRIIAGLQPEIDGLPFTLNGLGYNNLIFTAATLGTLQRSPDFLFRSVLVEEPEAHLHPHLQILLLRHFEKVTNNESSDDVQVIVSSHSPILVSQAPINSIVSIHVFDEKISAISICSIEMDKKLKKKLQRFLDATRGELFFARRLLMVEGIAEALLLPVLSKIVGGCLKSSAITLLNAGGINFNAFLPLFGENGLGIPVAIITDGDAKNVGDPPSDTTAGLKAQEQEIANLHVQYCDITFEHELARSPAILSLMLDAFENLHPRLGQALKTDIHALSLEEEKADKFLKELIRSKTSKGEFAQELAILLGEATLQLTDVPTYIRETLIFLKVVPAIISID